MQIQKSKNTADIRNIKYQKKGKEWRQSEWSKREEKLEGRKDDQKLRGDVNFEVFQDDRELVNQEEYNLTGNENCSGDNKLLWVATSQKLGGITLGEGDNTTEIQHQTTWEMKVMQMI